MSTPRYFEAFFNADPMVELTETAARELGSYVVEDGGPLRRYRRISDNELSSVVYTGLDDPSQALAEVDRLWRGVPAEINSPVEPCADGGKRWRTWYVTPAGGVEKILEREYDAAGNILRENLRSPDGQLVSCTIYRYAEDGFLIDLVTYAPDGTMMNRQDAQ